MFDPTETGGYTGNTLAPQAALKRVLARQFDGLDILKEICSAVLSQHIAARYEGPLGVDMMLVKMAQGIMLHPCIEVNLRRTMGICGTRRATCRIRLALGAETVVWVVFVDVNAKKMCVLLG